MDITVKDLRGALELLAPVVPRKAALPVLRNILMEGTRAMASNLEMFATVDLEQEVGGRFCIPHPSLYDLLQYTPGDTMVTLVGGPTLGVTIRGGTAALVAGVVEDYPPLPGLEDPKVAVLDGSALVKAIREVIPYAAKESSRPVLTALCLTLGAPGEVAAADGYRLTIQPLPDRHPHLEGQRLLLPASALKVLTHLWRHAGAAPSDESGDLASLVVGKRLVRLEYDGKLARFTFGKVTLTTQLVQESFPDYRPLVPTAPDAVCSFLAEDIRQAVNALENMAAQGGDIIRLQWEGQVMTLSARATEVGEVSAQVRLLSSSQPGRIAISVKYLGPLLKARDGIMTMEATTPSAPAVFKASGHPLVVLMPMFVEDRGPAPAAEAEEPQPQEEPEEAAGGQAPEAQPQPVRARKERKGRKKK